MYQLINKQNKRIINIIELLLNSIDNTCDAETIYTYNQCSALTVDNDIDLINQRWPELFSIEKYANLYVLTKGSNGNLRLITRDVLKESDLLLILFSIYKQNGIHISELANEVHLSDSSVRRALHALNDYLYEYKIQISIQNKQVYLDTESEIVLRILIFNILLSMDEPQTH